MISETQVSRYLDDLPAVFRQEGPTGGPGFLGRFLLGFEQVLTGVGDPTNPGLEEILEGIAGPFGTQALAGAHRYFDPGPGLPDGLRAPADFLEWLSGWVALTFRDDWREEERRRILAEIVPAYRQRGTPDGLRQILSAFTGLPAATITILEFTEPLQIGVSSTVGEGTVMDEGPSHYFQVRVLLAARTDLARQRAILRSIIDAEKPAHTYYDLFLDIPTLQVGVRSTVGRDTFLGRVASKDQGGVSHG